ncbi:sensor histidine kinase [Rhizobium sullae]|uniref:Histidine kinase n=1 Tax=Rhizobium sullae TaxID=50338 RepID=A0A4R3QB60_RHISU|nr:sensor histidine kinase [Rhizobium sullae]TCU15276.1 histidine kinase [Rhizobium sullae]
MRMKVWRNFILRGYNASPVRPQDLSTTDEADAPSRQTTWINTHRAGADKVIAIGRVMSAIGSVFLSWLDAEHQLIPAEFVFPLLSAYLSYAILCAIHVWRSKISRVSGTLIRHVVDVATFVVFMLLTGGASSPFFIFMPFVLLSATLHWRWRGAFWTALVCMTVPVYLIAFETTADVTTDMSDMLFVTVAGTLLVWLGAHQEVIRAEMLRLVEKTPAAPEGPEWPAGAALEYAAHVMHLPRALLIWSDSDEPWTYVAVRKNGACSVAQLPPDAYWPWVAEPLQRASLLIADAAHSQVLVHRGEGYFDEWADAMSPVCPKLAADFSIASAVSTQFRVDDLEARIFLLDPPTLSLDDVAVAEVIADRIKAVFEQAMFMRRLSDAAAVEERIKIGRDLHDGVLQALAGTALQLESLRSFALGEHQQIDGRVTAIQAMLADEQRELRSFIHALEPGQGYRTLPESHLALQFEALARRLRKQWSIDIRFALNPIDLRLPATMVYELIRMASEATANAVRHGGARTLEINLQLDVGTILLTVDDDGSGFGFERRFDHAELKNSKTGPRSLRERAAARGGELSIDRVAQWTRILIRLPVHP